MHYCIIASTVIFHSILFCYILFHSILLYSIPFYSVIFHSILFHSILLYSILFYSIPFYSILFCLKDKRSKLRRVIFDDRILCYMMLRKVVRNGICKCHEKTDWTKSSKWNRIRVWGEVERNDQHDCKGHFVKKNDHQHNQLNWFRLKIASLKGNQAKINQNVIKYNSISDFLTLLQFSIDLNLDSLNLIQSNTIWFSQIPFYSVKYHFIQVSLYLLNFD